MPNDPKTPALPPPIFARGWPLLPLYEPVGSVCSCGDQACASPGKHPRNKTGATGASADLERIVNWLDRWPTCGWGVACGGEARLLVIDVDLRPGFDGEDTLRALGSLPDCPTVETGSGGRHYYLRLPDGASCHNSAGKLGRGLDVRWTGGYVVAPGSMHVSGRPYRWVEYEEMAPPEAPAWLVTLLAEPSRPAPKVVQGDKIVHGRHQWILDVTARMVAWGLSDAAILAAVQLDVPNKLDLSDGRRVTVKEITDAVAGARGKGFDAEDQGALAAMGKASADALTAQANKPVTDRYTRRKDGPPALASLAALIPGTAGGLRLLVDACLADAHRPQPEIALGAALATWSAVLGGRVELEDSTRSNMYLVAVAESGSGKDAPRNACKRALLAAGLRDVLGSDAWASHAGLHAQIAGQGQSVSFVDEFGKLVEAVSAERAPQYLKEIPNVLLKVYGSSADLYLGTAYADRSKDVQVLCPHLSIFGTSTYGTLFGSLTRQACGDGLLARTLLFTVGDNLPAKRHDVVRTAPSAELVDALKTWAAYGKGDVGARCARVPVSRDARTALEAYSDECDAWIRANQGSPVRSLYSRCHASAKKVALVHACATTMPDDHADGPVVSLDSAAWAIAFVRHCTGYAVRECLRSIGETKHERLLIDLEDHVRKNPGLTLTSLGQEWRRVPDRQRRELLHELLDQGRVRTEERKPEEGKGRTATVLFAV